MAEKLCGVDTGTVRFVALRATDGELRWRFHDEIGESGDPARSAAAVFACAAG